MIKLATWNVNSLRVRLPHVLDWLATTQPNICLLQETKLTDEHFPKEALEEVGYFAHFHGQKTYNGVATLSKQQSQLVAKCLPDMYDDAQARILVTEHEKMLVINVYVPNGAAVGTDKYQYKLRWLKALDNLVSKLQEEHESIIISGDFNIAPDDDDVHDADIWKDCILVSAPEREAFQNLLAKGFRDCFRLFSQELKSFSWWDYRAGAFRRNHGLRIDHILASDSCALKCGRCYIDTAPRRLERPSDHTPVVSEFDV